MSTNIPSRIAHARRSGAEYAQIAGTLFARISNTGHSSARFGACHVCGKHADTVYHASFGVAFMYDDMDARDLGVVAGDWGVTYHMAPGGQWGHLACLEAHAAKVGAAWGDA